MTLTLLVAAVVIVPGCSGGRVSTAPASQATAPATSTSKIRIVPGLAEPLVTTKPTTETEDRDLAEATQGRDGAQAPLLAFLSDHPDSGWNAAIHTNIGLAYYRQGFFSKAIASYEAAWREGRAATDFRAKTLVDRAVAELVRMHARVGHLKEVEALVAEIGSQPIQGGASELLTDAREGAWSMRNNPGVSFLCGPKALGHVLQAVHAAPAAIAVADAARSGEHGFTLAQLSALADKAGLAHRVVHRDPGQPVPVPSIINWRVSHYAAIVGATERGTYQVKDPTFGGDLEISEAAIDEEGTGFFIVPAQADRVQNDQRLAWRDATPGEAQTVYGMGDPQTVTPGHVTCADPSAADVSGGNANSGGLGGGQCTAPTAPICPAKGICVPNARAMEVSLSISDSPIGYQPPVGPGAYVHLEYNQREAVEPYGPPSNAVSFNVGPHWTLNLLSYVLDNPTSPGAGVARYFPGGGALSSYPGYNGSAPGAFAAEEQTGAGLSRAPATGMATSYTLTNTDGSQLVYAQNDGSTSASTYRRIFLTSIIDPRGNALTLNYDTTLATDAGLEAPDSGFDAGTATFFPRLSSVTDATGVTALTFAYGLPATPLLVTQITDAFGRSASIQYYPEGRLWKITDVIGITSTVSYGDGTTPLNPDFITQLATPYGPTTFNYNETSSGTNVVSRWLETTDPLNQTERLELTEGAPAGQQDGIPAPDETGAALPLPAGMPLSLAQAATLLMYRNTFFWNKHVYPMAKGASTTTATKFDYTQAEIVHWLHTDDGLSVAPTIESIRHPLEHRTWYQYAPSQTNAVLEGTPSTYLGAPTTIARVLDDGSTQLTSITRNLLGKPTLATDPLGRQTRFTYAANNTDLKLVQQETGSGLSTLATYGSYVNHQPLTYTDASGQTTQYAYSPAGQLVRRTDALGNAVVYGYDPLGRLQTVTDAHNNSVLATISYQMNTCNANGNANLPQSVTDAVGYTVGYCYDAADRVIQKTYPDGSSEAYGWIFASGINTGTQSLDLQSYTDRLGRTTTYAYDANRRLMSVTDPLGQTTKYGYYADGTLQSLTDPRGNATIWDIDIESRPTVKHYIDGTSEAYTYDHSTSRLQSETDARGQVTSYSYNADNSLAGIGYTNLGSTTAETAPVSFLYDPFFPRLTGMTDGVGTTTYSYYPIPVAPAQAGDAGVAATAPTLGAGKLQFVASPVAGATGAAPDVLSYSYDALGRASGWGVAGASQTVGFDWLGRPLTVSNTLDSFTYGYTDETPRPTSVTSGQGPSLTLGYWDPAANPEQNELLKQMTYTPPGGGPALSVFGYGYYPDGNVKTFSETHPGPFTSTPDAGSSADSGETGMNMPRILKGHPGGAKPAASAFTRTRVAARGNGGVLIFAAGLLLAAIAWVRTPRRRIASALTPFALGLVFAACGSGDDNSGGGSVTDASADGHAVPDGGSDATVADASAPEAGSDGGLALQTQVTTYQYDAASRLTSATLGPTATPPDSGVTPQYAYGYDLASNPTSVTANGTTQTPSYTGTNAIIGGNYDPNGSPTTLDGATYSWDAANRLASATVNGIESDFTYDGQSRIVRIVSTQGGTTLSDKAYTWSGTTRVAEHDNAKSGSPVSKHYFAQGVVKNGTGYYYSTDRLGSVRQLTDVSGAIHAQYDYDPYGYQNKLNGDVDSDLGYAGYFHHSMSGLVLTVYRAYDPKEARWLNRDPIRENGGVNMYAYTLNNPVKYRDAKGLQFQYTEQRSEPEPDPEETYNEINERIEEIKAIGEGMDLINQIGEKILDSQESGDPFLISDQYLPAYYKKAFEQYMDAHAPGPVCTKDNPSGGPEMHSTPPNEQTKYLVLYWTDDDMGFHIALVSQDQLQRIQNSGHMLK